MLAALIVATASLVGCKGTPSPTPTSPIDDPAASKQDEGSAAPPLSDPEAAKVRSVESTGWGQVALVRQQNGSKMRIQVRAVDDCFGGCDDIEATCKVTVAGRELIVESWAKVTAASGLHACPDVCETRDAICPVELAPGRYVLTYGEQRSDVIVGPDAPTTQGPLRADPW